ncbi:SCP-like extracellular [Syncephalis pseudoplumigaleata]|uniref:SCP-like extracellular n=1 Tax=Syncephalis pseudoplumigaleata TaxID=1712513 RepID=A0A4P9YXK7_9FUNG|nr:SCP-like extracellular [Syncephalis pseudoplumigaleata]|eukprot:RKP24816.1 SCP-like extracellular [Syncephalis pseudoplumigaleata]
MPAKMLCEVNRIRHNQGLQPLGLDEGLNKSAAQHSKVQAANNAMGHQFYGEATPMQRMDQYGNWMRAAENVAYGWETPEVAMQKWVGSPDHYANMMLPDLTHFGAGVAYSGSTPYWTQNFGKDTRKPKDIPQC